ncbi:MAG: NTP transferase domain-containing protein, partial [Clostridia bacterium]|nr:NTP transferase domain-containing protein [Clostridia bacterium]
FDATLVVMAAGMGSRFGGLKQIEPVGPGGQAIIDFSVYDAKAAGFNKVVFIIKHEIEKDFKEIVGSRIEKMIDVDYAYQELNMLPDGFVCPDDRQKPWGTAHAIYCARNVVNTPFAVINADDYYGKSAYQKMYNHLKEQKGDFCMVGFRLQNTLTENGTVSRGICEVENGKLTAVTERTKILDCKYTEDDTNWVELPPDAIVSMNMWGFTPDVFTYIENDLKEFFAEKINVPKVEYYLPTVVSNVIERGQKDVSVLVAEDRWYGVTYKEDKAGVVTALSEKINNGEYEGF